MRKLASIRKVRKIESIEGADRIEIVTVDGWQVVANKGLHQMSNLVIYCEIDSFLPIREEYEFLRRTSYKKMADGSEGFRLKSLRLRGVLSQGLILRMDFLPKGDYQVGDDVTELLGIQKYEPPMPPSLEGIAKGAFPSFIRKTDEERIQNLAEEYNTYRQYHYFASEKIDGTSCTIYYNQHLEGEDDLFGLCSRNYNLEETDNSTQWRIARDFNLENKMRKLARNIALQGEIIGEGIQKNLYKLKGQHFKLFNIFDIDKHEYLSKKEMLEIAQTLGIQTVPTVYESITLPKNIDEILKMAEGKSLIFPQQEREGLVWVSVDAPKRISFKTISNRYLLKMK
jgi:RNA ligase (TIGR02306 family)